MSSNPTIPTSYATPCRQRWYFTTSIKPWQRTMLVSPWVSTSPRHSQPPFPETFPGDPILLHPAAYVQAARHRSTPCSGALQRGCRSALGARVHPRRGVSTGGWRQGVPGGRTRRRRHKSTFEMPFRRLSATEKLTQLLDSIFPGQLTRCGHFLDEIH